MTDEPLVSVIVPTYNSEKYLRKTLQSIENQTYVNIELLVVDNDSEDRTKEIAREFTENVFNEGDGRCEQMNAGFEKANGDYYYRVDSDFLLDEKVVDDCVDECEKNGADAVCVHNTSDPTVSFWSKVRKFERDFYKYDDANVAARFFKAEVIEDVGGFNEDMVAGEDYDLHNRIEDAGYNVGYVDPEEIHLGEPEKLRQILEKHYYYGKTLDEYREENQEESSQQMGFIRPAYIDKKERFLKNPLMTVAFLFYQTSRYAAAGLGLAISKVRKIG